MFYFIPMFYNHEKYFIGRDKDNNFWLINEIKLPKWAHANPHIYCMKNRLFINDMKYEEKNMDQNYVEIKDFFYSKDLEKWIDLVFGVD